MFDLTSSKLLILGVVALIVVGPKELPFLLRTIGKYVAMVRRHANEFRAQFDDAMREAELDGIKKELEAVARDTEQTIRGAQSTVEQDVGAATRDLDHSILASPAAAGEISAAATGLDTPAVEPTLIPDAQAAAPEAVTPTPTHEAPQSTPEAPHTATAADGHALHPDAAGTPELAKTGS